MGVGPPWKSSDPQCKHMKEKPMDRVLTPSGYMSAHTVIIRYIS